MFTKLCGSVVAALGASFALSCEVLSTAVQGICLYPHDRSVNM